MPQDGRWTTVKVIGDLARYVDIGLHTTYAVT